MKLLTNKQKTKRLVHITVGLLIAIVALAAGLVNAMNTAAGAVKNLPGIFALGITPLQIVTSILAAFSMLLNIYFVFKLLPLASQVIFEFFKKFSTLSRGKQIASVLAVVATISAGVATAYFAFYSAPIAIVGMFSLFGVAAFPPLTTIALAAALIQFVVSSFLLLKSSIRFIEQFSWQALKTKLSPSSQTKLALTSKERHLRIASIIARVLGAVILLAASLFVTLVKGDAFINTMLPKIGATAAWIFNVSVIYIASGVLGIILSLDTANSTFHRVGRAAGSLLYQIKDWLRHPLTSLINGFTSITNKLKSMQKLWDNDRPEFWATVGRKSTAIGRLTVLSLLMIGNGLAKFLINSGGTKPFRGDSSYHLAADKIAQHSTPAAPNAEAMLEAIKNTERVPLEAPEIIAGASTTTASISIIAANTLFAPKHSKRIAANKQNDKSKSESKPLLFNDSFALKPAYARLA